MQRHMSRFNEIMDGIANYEDDYGTLFGVTAAESREVFVKQIIDSIRRVEYVYVISGARLSDERKNPDSPSFDPIKASILHRNNNQIEEAFWLAFLAINFGKDRTNGWLLSRLFYGRLGGGQVWSWESVKNNVDELSSWLRDNYQNFQSHSPKPKFGNHRKYETLNPDSKSWNFYALNDYIEIINGYGSHIDLLQFCNREFESEPCKCFDFLYDKFSRIRRFGRTAVFDYLTMISKLSLYELAPSEAYMNGSTGPAAGAKLLFLEDPNQRISSNDLQEHINNLNGYLNLGLLSMQILEDALCNWQKSPNSYEYFSG